MMFKGIFFGIFVWAVSATTTVEENVKTERQVTIKTTSRLMKIFKPQIEPTYIAPISLRVDESGECVDKHDQKEQDIYEGFAILLAEDIEQFHKNFLKWKTNMRIPFYKQDDVIHLTGQKPTSANYSISFSDVSYSYFTIIADSFLRTDIIECEFNDNVKLTVRPMPVRDIKLVGEIYITKEELPNLNVTATYEISFTNPTFLYIVKQNSNLFHEHPNIQPETKMTYSQYEVLLSVGSGYESIVEPFMSEIENEIEFTLKSIVTKQLTNFIKQSPSFRTIFTSCMNPRRDRDFQSLERYGDYATKGSPVDHSYNITINSLTINGLSHFKSIKIGGGRFFFDFDLRFDNLKGYVNLTHRSDADGAEKSAKLKFQAKDLTMSGTIDNMLPEIRDTRVGFRPSSICLPSNDTSTSFDVENLNTKIVEIINSSTMQPIFQRFLQKIEVDQDYNSTLSLFKPSLLPANNQSLIVN